MSERRSLMGSSPDAARWNEAMTRLLREAAEVRDLLEQARWAEDRRLANQQAEACIALIGARRRPTDGAGRSQRSLTQGGGRARLERQ